MPKSEQLANQLTLSGLVEVRASRLKLAGLVLLAILMTFACLAVAVGADGLAMVVGWLGVVFFGVLGIPVLIYKLIAGRVEVRATHDGVWVRQFGETVLPWSDIGPVQAGKMSHNTFAVIRLDEATYETVMASSVSGTVLASANAKVLDGPGVMIPSGLSVKPAVLAEWLEQERNTRG